MLLSDTLEVAIGVTFIYLLVSLFITSVVEFIESIRRKRGASLFYGVMEMLDDTGKVGSGEAAARALYSHPLVQGLYVGDINTATRNRVLPSYLPSKSFALALIDQVVAGKVNAAPTKATLPDGAPIGERLRFAAERIENDQVRRALCLAVQLGGNDLERITKHLEGWFDAAMERVAGRYKRHTQHLTFSIGLGAAILLNVNTLVIADTLSKDATLRRAVVAQAEAAHDISKTDEAIQRINETGLPIGWSDHARKLAFANTDLPGLREKLFSYLQLAVGYLVTALAVSLGAPFWFDVLKKLMVIRSTVKPSEPQPSQQFPPDSPNPPRGDSASVAIGSLALAGTLSGLIDNDIYAAAPAVGDKLFEEWE